MIRALDSSKLEIASFSWPCPSPILHPTRLLDAGSISRYELQPDRIVFYLWSPQAEGSHFTFRFTPRYAIHAKAAPAILSDYYNPNLSVVLAPHLLSVTGPSQK